MSDWPKILVIPDTQCKPDVPLDHLEWAARYALRKRPDVIVHLGDHADMPSLSSYDGPGLKGAEQRDIANDIDAANQALELFEAVLRTHNRSNPHRRRYTPRKVFLVGNHEHRIDRAIAHEPWLRGMFAKHTLDFAKRGWEVYPFLQPVIICGIKFAHYFVRGASGRVTQTKRGMPSAKAQVIREGMSATAGHQQGLDFHAQPVGHTVHRGLIAGSYYLHDEDYLSPQGNAHWRGLVLKHECKDGDYDLCEVSIEYLRRQFA